MALLLFVDHYFQFLDADFHLFFVQLINDFILFSYLRLQVLDCMVTVALIFLNLSELNFSLFLNFKSFCLAICVNRDITLFFGKLLRHGSDFILQVSQLSFKVSCCIKSSFVFTISCIGLFFKKSQFFLGVWKSDKTSCLLDNGKPSPISHGKVFPEVSLSYFNEFTLISFLLIHSRADSLENFSLHKSNPFDHKHITGLLESCKGTCSEEHQGMTKSVSFPIKIDLIHQGINCSFVVTRACNFSLAQACISHLVVRIQHAVWKAAHADPDSFQHTIAGKLV